MKWFFVALLLGGCQVLFPLTPDPPPPPDAPPGDRDSDGFTDDLDNCPDVANADQHDEDRDAVGDVCDNCPHFANAGQDEDTDGDHLGAACDGSDSIDCIVHFDPFVTAPATDETTIGTWTAIEDELLQNALVPDGYLLADPTVRSSPRIIVGARVVEHGADNTLPSHGVWFFEGDQLGSPGVPMIGFRAEITRTMTINPRTTASIQLSEPAMTIKHELLNPATNLEVGAPTEVELDLRGFGLSATGTIVGIADRTVVGTGMIGSGRVALRAFQQRVAFRYLLVIERMQLGCPPR